MRAPRQCPVCATLFEPAYYQNTPYCSLECRLNSSRDMSSGPDGCWVWTDPANDKGYGVFNFHNKLHRAHVVAYELANGPIPEGEGLVVCHTCDNPPCCNPAHLWLGTRGDNAADRDRKKRTNPGWVPGSKNGLAKLTEELIPIIRRRAATGETHRKLADDFGVSKGAITAICVRRNWRHVL